MSSPRSGARRGEQVIERLRTSPPNLFYDGKRVEDPTTHPALAGGVKSLAALYDVQWREADKTLFPSLDSGHQVSRAFQIPKTLEDLRAVSASMKVRADWSLGMMGRHQTI